jgi:hypothetical protein
LEYFYEMGFTLTANPKDDNSRIFMRGVIPNVKRMGDVGVESSEKGKGSKSEYGMGDIL